MPEGRLRKRKYLIVPKRRRAEAAPTEEPPGVGAGRSRREMVAEAAYYLSLRGGGQVGDPERDWAEAERQIDELLARSPGGADH